MLLTLVFVWGLALIVPTVLTAEVHVFEAAFGPDGEASSTFQKAGSLAVDQSTHELYLADLEAGTVQKFNAAHEPEAFTASNPEVLDGKLSGFSFTGNQAAALNQLAVDSSSHELYVLAFNHPLKAFQPDGEAADFSAGPGAGSNELTGSELCGVAVDASGDIYLSEAGEVKIYAPSGEPLTTIAQGARCNLAVDSHGTVYTTVFGGGVEAFTPSEFPVTSATTYSSTGTVDANATKSVAVDSGTDHLYVDEGSKVAEYDEAGTRLGEFGESGPGALSASEGLAADSSAGQIYVSDVKGKQQAEIFGPTVLLPDVTTTEATNLTTAAGQARLNGVVNPDGLAVTSCEFEYGSSSAYGSSAPCSPSPGAGATPIALSAELTGLTPGVVYHYRLVAANANGQNDGLDASFTAPGVVVHSASVTDVTSESVSFHAGIDPNGTPTRYFFQYGTSAEYGQSAPLSPAFLGEGSGEVQSAPQSVVGLNANTLYHYRVVAIGELSPGHSQQFTGADQTFQTNSTENAAALPDNRQWELVSPADKHGALLEPINETGVIEAAANGDAISYLANGPTEAGPEGSSNSVQVLARRLSTGWASKDIATPHEAATGALVGGGQEYRFFSEDLSESLVQPAGEFLALSPAASEQTPYLRTDFAAGDVGEACEPATMQCYRPLVSGCPASGPCAKAIEEGANVAAGTVFANNRNDGACANPIFRPAIFNCRPRFIAATPELDHVVLESEVDLTAGTPGATPRDLYEWAQGGLDRVGAIAQLGENAFHAISPDGARIVFDGESEGKSGLLLRDTAKGRTLQLDAGEAGCGECESGGGQFREATPDVGRVYFTDAKRLTANAGAEAGAPDLYECAIAEGPGGPECVLSDLTPAGPGGAAANAQGMLGASEDGSYLYYAAGATNAPHVYVRHGGASRLIGVLAETDESDWEARLKYHTARVSANGRWLAFLSEEPLTGYDTRDALTGKADMEVYLYDASDGRLVCASCDPSGARPVGIEYAKISTSNGGLAGGDRILPSPEQGVAAMIPGGTPITGEQSLYQSRYLLNSGRLFFNSHDALVAQDVNDTMDVYEYEPAGVPEGSPSACTSADRTFSASSGGCVGLISAGTSPFESAFLDASESGGDVFFLTYSRLLPRQDIDGEIDVYDAHECSASAPCLGAAAESPPPCGSGEACKPAPTPQPEIFGAPSSATFSGAGNPPIQAQAPAPKAKPATRAQLLAKALSACAKKPKAKRKSCQAAARKRYGPKAKAKAKSKRKATHRKGH